MLRDFPVRLLYNNIITFPYRIYLTSNATMNKITAKLLSFINTETNRRTGKSSEMKHKWRCAVQAVARSIKLLESYLGKRTKVRDKRNESELLIIIDLFWMFIVRYRRT